MPLGDLDGADSAGIDADLVGDRADQITRAEADVPPRPDSLPSLKEAESRIVQSQNPNPPYAVGFFEQFLRRDQPDLWNYLRQHYTAEKHFPGRLSPATIYIRTAPPTTQP